MTGADWIPFAFAAIMGIAMLVYAILDGYDLGVGILLKRATPKQQDEMISSIGPFWDANETWLVLGVGILLVAFPQAHGIILTSLYLPVAVMLFGLILRGVSFDFRAKAHAKHKFWWDGAFFYGSVIASVAQGYMLGQYILGFAGGIISHLFSLLIGAAFVAGYALIGACWLILKTEGALQKRAVYWARRCLWLVAVGVALVSVTTPMVSPRIFESWFSFPNILILSPIPIATGMLFIAMEMLLRKMPKKNDANAISPFLMAVAIYILCFLGLAYSFFPYIVPDRLTIWEAASAPESLLIIFVGAAVVVPAIGAYTIFAYRVFRGKAKELSYD